MSLIQENSTYLPWKKAAWAARKAYKKITTRLPRRKRIRKTKLKSIKIK